METDAGEPAEGSRVTQKRRAVIIASVAGAVCLLVLNAPRWWGLVPERYSSALFPVTVLALLVAPAVALVYGYRALRGSKRAGTSVLPLLAIAAGILVLLALVAMILVLMALRDVE